MSRESRLKEYADPMRGPHGASRDQSTLDYWSDYTEANSEIGPRAAGGAMSLASTGKAVPNRDTSMRPYAQRKSGDAVIDQARGDLNYKGSGGSYLPGIRRNA